MGPWGSCWYDMSCQCNALLPCRPTTHPHVELFDLIKLSPPPPPESRGHKRTSALGCGHKGTMIEVVPRQPQSFILHVSCLLIYSPSHPSLSQSPCALCFSPSRSLFHSPSSPTSHLRGLMRESAPLDYRKLKISPRRLSNLSLWPTPALLSHALSLSLSLIISTSGTLLTLTIPSSTE